MTQKVTSAVQSIYRALKEKSHSLTVLERKNQELQSAMAGQEQEMALLHQENSNLTFSIRKKPTKNLYVQTEMIAQDVDQAFEMAEELRQRSLQDQEQVGALQA